MIPGVDKIMSVVDETMARSGRNNITEWTKNIRNGKNNVSNGKTNTVEFEK